MFTNVKAVLFDLDGTLIDSAPDLGAAANRMRIKRGLSVLPLDQYRPLAGAGARGMLSIGFGLTPDADNFNAMREEFFAEFERDLIANTVVFDQVDELIQTIEQRGYLWGVVTNKAERFTLPTTQQMPLFRNASCIVSGDTTPHAKPHPMPLLEAAKRAGALPEECIYVAMMNVTLLRALPRVCRPWRCNMAISAPMPTPVVGVHKRPLPSPCSYSAS